MKDKKLSCLIDELHKIQGVTYILPFDDILTIDYDRRWVRGGFDEDDFLKKIKQVVGKHEFKMLTLKTTSSKKIINIIPI